MVDTPEPIESPADDLANVRELIRRSHPDTVPELIAGETIADLLASIEPARAAYTRVAASIPPVTIPAGGNSPILVEADSLPTSEKIRRGLAATRKA